MTTQEPSLKINNHGLLRSYERTGMHPNDILALIKAKKTISLGKNAEYEYLLFHSFFDQEGRIAVIDVQSQILCTVWFPWYSLDKGIRRPNDVTLREVRKLAYEFIAEHNLVHGVSTVRIIVMTRKARKLNFHKEYESDLIPIPRLETRDLLSACKFLREHLLPIQTEIEKALPGQQIETVWYRLHFVRTARTHYFETSASRIRKILSQP